jgi:TP901 family phage tail tape measure protein
MATRPIVVNIQGDSSGLNKALRSASGKVSAFGKSVAKVGLKAGTVFAGAAAAIGVKGVTAFAEFDKGMREIKTLMPDISDKAFGVMTKDLQGFQKQFGVLSDKAIPAMYGALSAGVPPDNVMDFLVTSQKLAKAGATDLEVALDGITSAVNAYTPAVLSAESASDLMFTAVKLGKTTVSEVSKSLFQMTPIAAAAGVQFKSLTASIAVLTASGTPTSVAATQMKAAISELSKEGTGADKAFRAMSGGKGLTTFISEGGTLAEAFNMLAAGAKASGQSVLDSFGSIEAGAAVLALTSDGGVKFADALRQMDDAAGATDTAFEVMNKGLAASMDRIKANIEVLVIEIGAKLAPIAEKATALMLKGFKNLKPAIARGKEMAIEFTKVAKARLVPIMQRAREIFDQVAEKAMAVYDAVVTYLAPGFNKVKDAVVEFLEQGLNKIVELFNSVNWGEVGQAIADGFETARAAVMEFVRDIPDRFRQALAWIEKNKDMLIVLGGAIAGLTAGYIAFVTAQKVAATWTKITTTLTAAWNAVMSANPIFVVTALIFALVGALIAAYFRFERVREIVDNVGRFFRDDFMPTVQDVWRTITEAVKATVDFFQNDFLPRTKQIITDTIDAFKKAWHYLQDVFGPAVKVAIDVVVELFNFMKKQIKIVFDLVRALIDGDWNKATKLFVEFIKNAVGFVVGFFIKLPGRLLEAMPPILLALFKIAKLFVTYFQEKVRKVIGKIVDFFIGLPASLLSAGIQIASALISMGIDFGKSIIDGLLEGLRRAGGAISSYIMSLVPDVGSIVDSIVGGAKSAAKGMLKSVIPGFAAGGIVTRPTLAMVGEGGESEAIIPLSKLGQMGSGGTVINLTVNAGVGTDGVQVGDDIVAALTTWQRHNGSLPLDIAAA